MIINLPCKPQAYYMLQKLYGSKLQLNCNDDAAAFIFNQLIKQHKNGNSNNFKTYIKEFPIYISNSLFFRYGINSITKHAIYSINRYLLTQFENAFLIYVLYNSNKKIKERIEDFMVDYQIDEDILSFEALKKEFYKFRNGKKKKYQIYYKKNKHALGTLI